MTSLPSLVLHPRQAFWVKFNFPFVAPKPEAVAEPTPQEPPKSKPVTTSTAPPPAYQPKNKYRPQVQQMVFDDVVATPQEPPPAVPVPVGAEEPKQPQRSKSVELTKRKTKQPEGTDLGFLDDLDQDLDQVQTPLPSFFLPHYCPSTHPLLATFVNLGSHRLLAISNPPAFTC